MPTDAVGVVSDMYTCQNTLHLNRANTLPARRATPLRCLIGFCLTLLLASAVHGQPLPVSLGDTVGGLAGGLPSGANPLGAGGNLPGILPENALMGGSNNLDFVGAQQLLGSLGLAPGSDAANALNNAALGGATVVPLVNSISALSGLSASSVDILSAITLPGLGESLLTLDVAGTGNAAGLSGIAFLNPGPSANGVVGVAVLSGNNTGNGDLIGVSLLGGSNSGNGALTGLAVGSGGGLVSLNVLPSSQAANESCEGAACGEETDDRTALAGEELPRCDAGDSDSDGVCDDTDSCPETPEKAAVLPNGCHLDLDQPLILEGIRFAPASTRFHRESLETLEQAAQILRNYPDAWIVIEGHTDSSGDANFNTRLSRRRAEAVKTFLSHRGIDEDRLLATGYGSARPLAGIPATSALQRRVQLTVVEAGEFRQTEADEKTRRTAEEEAARRAKAADIARARAARQAAEEQALRETRQQEADDAYKDVLEFLRDAGVAAPE